MDKKLSLEEIAKIIRQQKIVKIIFAGLLIYSSVQGVNNLIESERSKRNAIYFLADEDNQKAKDSITESRKYFKTGLLDGSLALIALSGWMASSIVSRYYKKQEEDLKKEQAVLTRE